MEIIVDSWINKYIKNKLFNLDLNQNRHQYKLTIKLSIEIIIINFKPDSKVWWIIKFSKLDVYIERGQRMHR